jgi:hypothetical protein
MALKELSEHRPASGDNPRISEMEQQATFINKEKAGWIENYPSERWHKEKGS